MIKFVYFAIFLIGILNIIISKCETIVNLPDLGQLKGSLGQTAWTKNYIMQFLGIPYAESPSGQLRFKAPVPKSKWDGVKSTIEYGRPCPSKKNLDNIETVNSHEDIEDCLSLCVYTKILEEQNYPVMVYIHGGDFISESSSFYPSNYILEFDVVLVTIQYRLGLFGFASTKSNDIPGNVGVMDIIMGLEWIQKYIKYFGGDSNNVIIFGQESGAVISSLLMISPKMQNSNLFQKIILHSGNILVPWAIETNPIEKLQNVCNHLMCYNNCDNINSINACLMNAAPKDLIKFEENSKITLNDLNGILPDYPRILMNEIQNKVAVLGGTTKNDGVHLLHAIYEQLKNNNSTNSDDVNIIDLITFISEKYCNLNIDNTGITEILSLQAFFNLNDLINKDFEKLWPSFQDMISTCYVKASMVRFLKLYAKDNSENVYLYSFEYTGERNNNDKSNIPFQNVIGNGDDLLYLFPRPEKLNLNEDDITFSDKFIKLWTEFARTGNIVLTNENSKELLSLTNSSLKLPYLHINDEITIGDNYLTELFLSKNANNVGYKQKFSKNLFYYGFFVIIMINSKLYQNLIKL